MFLEMIRELRNDLNEKLIYSSNEDGLNIRAQIKTVDNIINMYNMINLKYISKLRFVKSDNIVNNLDLDKQLDKIEEEYCEFLDITHARNKNRMNEELQDLIQACVHFYYLLNQDDLIPNELHIEKMKYKFDLK